MSEYIANTGDQIDWDEVIKLCQASTNGDRNTVTSVVDRSEAEAVSDQKLLGYYRSVIGTWQKAGYNLEEIEWYIITPGFISLNRFATHFLT
jgi:hypothetical protein